MPLAPESKHTAADKQVTKQEHRPAGFGSAAVRKTVNKAEETETTEKAAKKRSLFAFLKRNKKKKRVKKPRVKRAKKVPSKAKRKKIGRAELIVIGIIAVLLCAAAAAVIVVTGNRTVHQMPVILRITEEPTAEPVQTAAPMSE